MQPVLFTKSKWPMITSCANSRGLEGKAMAFDKKVSCIETGLDDEILLFKMLDVLRLIIKDVLQQ